MAPRSMVALLTVATLVAGAVAQEVCNIGEWTRPNDRALDATTAAEFGCGSTCQLILNQSITLDRQTIYGDTPFDATFYSTSSNFSTKTSKPGDLLKFEPYVNISSTWQIPAGSTLFAIEYVSEDVHGNPVPVSGFVNLPFAKPSVPGRKIPVVAFAHGTIGVLPGCAASSSFDLYDYFTWTPLWLQGFAVVATDYQGLGNGYVKHPWNAPTLQAKDVYYSVVAAKRALGHILKDEWMATGHSEGGAAVLALGTSDLVNPHKRPCQDVPLRFLGGVPISPSARIADLVADGLKDIDAFAQSGVEYAPYIYWGLEATEPGSGEGLFTEQMLKRIELGQHFGGCFYGWGALGLDLALGGGGADAVFRNFSGLASYPPLVAFQKKFGAGLGKPAKAPMLIVQSLGDKSVAANVTIDAFHATCKASGSVPVQLSLYPDLDHSATPGASAPEWLEWIRARFAGKTIHIPQCGLVKHYAEDSSTAFLPSG